MSQPLIGITVDNRENTISSGRYESSITYSRAIARAGGVPVLLPHEVKAAQPYVTACDGLVLTGGVDPRTENFNEPMHPKARPMDPQRQAFELALLREVRSRPQKCVLGVCLGMQLMALHAGGRLNQYLPDILPEPDIHQGDRPHELNFLANDSVASPRVRDRKFQIESTGADKNAQSGPCVVISNHQQAVADPGRLRIVARAPDGVIEAIDDPTRSFYIGVQWHPERGSGPDHCGFNQALFDRLILASADST